MQHNLLLKDYEKNVKMFLSLEISLENFIKIENDYAKRFKLFIIELN